MIKLNKFFVFLFMLFPVYVFSDVPPDQVNEIEHLVDFIKKTSCILERNNKKYTGPEAIVHILRKYDYYRDDIKSTEDFIRYSASKSEMTGKPYTAHCSDKTSVEVMIWLNSELSRYRELNTK